MARMIPSAERIKKAWALVEKARTLPVPPGMTKNDLSYLASVKDLLREARDLVKFIPKTPTATPEMKEEVKRIYAETEKVDHQVNRLDLPPE